MFNWGIMFLGKCEEGWWILDAEKAKGLRIELKEAFEWNESPKPEYYRKSGSWRGGRNKKSNKAAADSGCVLACRLNWTPKHAHTPAKPRAIGLWFVFSRKAAIINLKKYFSALHTYKTSQLTPPLTQVRSKAKPTDINFSLKLLMPLLLPPIRNA